MVAVVERGEVWGRSDGVCLGRREGGARGDGGMEEWDWSGDELMIASWLVNFESNSAW